MRNGNRDNYSISTLAAVEAALGWEPGSGAAVLAGGRPRRKFDADLMRLMDVWPLLSKDARALLVDMAERARRD